MVRINLIMPKSLSDQHLIAEYDEILMLLGYVRKYPVIRKNEIPKEYVLGKGHIKFFKDKLFYLKKRHELIKKEMRERGFKAQKNIRLEEFDRLLVNDWKPLQRDVLLIKQRIADKLKQKPGFYRYYRKHMPLDRFLKMLRNG